MTPRATSTLIVGLAVESTLWGAYVNLLFGSLVLCFRRAEHDRPPRPVFVMNGLLFVACTAHLICGLDAVWAATSVGVGVITGSPGDVLIPLCNSIGILMLVHRCWMLWGKQTWVVSPAGVAALLGFVLTSNFTYNPSDPDGVLTTILSVIGQTFFLYSNLSTTPLIAAGLDRLSYILSLDDTKGKTSLVSVPAVLIECGLLHLIVQTVQFLFVLMDHRLKYVVSAVAVQIYGFSSAMGLVRIGLGIIPATLPNVDVESIPTTEMEHEAAREAERAVLRAFYIEG
ncbi:hypothetical protein C8T65DRAFT_256632 [Cerioporus squamosus]|nr:hypothetical protein C8T65DRAFT_256632 [Cerioporus squamosus]